MKKFLHNLLVMILAGLVFAGSIYYESGYSVTEAKKRDNHFVVGGDKGVTIAVNRSGQNVALRIGDQIEVGDLLASAEQGTTDLHYSSDGRLRMSPNSRILLNLEDDEKAAYVFSVTEGEVWLNNMFSNADVNLLVGGAVINPGQSIVYVKVEGDKATVYSNTNNVYVNFVSTDYAPLAVIDDHSSEVINSLLLPQGTQATIFGSKIRDNQQTIGKLLFSKLIKEFQYSVFDKTQLKSNTWFTDNLEKDQLLALTVKNQRLKRIRERGLKYPSTDSLNYQLDEKTKDFFNLLTFSNEKIGERNLDFLYDFLFDSQYLFDVGRSEDANNRLNTFSVMAADLTSKYGDVLKKQYDLRVYDEYQYLSFVNPNDSLFALKKVLEKIYKESLVGSEQEIQVRFSFLTDKLNTLNFYAETNNFGFISAVFDEYIKEYDELFAKHKSELGKYVNQVQQQNQLLNNLFNQYSQFYRKNFFISKLKVENGYLSLLPEGPAKYEEIQTIISQRIDFLRRLQAYYLDEKIPLLDAQNIVILLITEIDKLKLPADVQLAVTKLFNERLKDFGVFHRYLNSTGYVNSAQKGRNQQERFNTFLAEQGSNVSISDVMAEVSAMSTQDLNYQLGSYVAPETVYQVNEEQVTSNLNGETSTVENQVDASLTDTTPSEIIPNEDLTTDLPTGTTVVVPGEEMISDVITTMTEAAATGDVATSTDVISEAQTVPRIKRK
jgi:hypothetical protein